MSGPDEKPPLVIREEQGLKSGIRPVIEYGAPQKPSTSKYPLSKVCPKCGCPDYKRVRPNITAAAFTYDRVCKVCGTRYTPPTPMWAAAIFILIGTIFTLWFGGGFIASFFRPGASFGEVGFGLLFCAFMAAIGIASIIHGIKALRAL